MTDFFTGLGVFLTGDSDFFLGEGDFFGLGESFFTGDRDLVGLGDCCIHSGAGESVSFVGSSSPSAFEMTQNYHTPNKHQRLGKICHRGSRDPG